MFRLKKQLEKILYNEFIVKNEVFVEYNIFILIDIELSFKYFIFGVQHNNYVKSFKPRTFWLQ